MKYSTPELVVIGAASALVQGVPFNILDRGSSNTSHPGAGILLGLDD